MTKPYLFVWAVLPALLACPAEVPAPVVPKSATVKTFSASPTEVKPNEAITLSWEVEDATSVSIRNAAGTAVPLPDAAADKGTVEVPVESSAVFVLTATGEGGADSAIASVVVASETAEPLFAAFPTTIRAGETASLVWNAPGASQIAITDAAGQTVVSGDKTSGSVEVKPGFTTAYTLNVDGKEQTVTVEVAAAILEFQSNVPAAAPGASVTLNWKAGGADSVTLSRTGHGVLVTVQTPAEIADGSFADTVPANLPSHGILEYVLEAKRGTTTTVGKLTVHVGTDPQVSFNVPGYVRDGMVAPMSWTTALADQVEVFVDGKLEYRAVSANDVRSGSLTVQSEGKDIVVELRATNVRGGSKIETRTISPVGVPTFQTFEAIPTTIANGGDPVTLSWTVDQARHVRITDSTGRVIHDATGLLDTGSVQVYPNKATQYVLSADNTVGDAIAAPLPTASATVTTPAKLTYSPATAPVGAPITVTGTTIANSGAIQGLPVFAKNAPGEQFVDISTTGVSANYGGPDTTGVVVTLPETFNTVIFGVPVSSNQLSLGNNGWFKFSASSYHGYEPISAFPTAALEPLAIAPFWADLYDVNGEIYYQLDTVGIERRLIVQWNEFEYEAADGSVVTVQAQVYSSGKIVFAYKTLRGVTNPAVSIGVVNATETDAAFTTTLPVEGDTFTFFGKAVPPVTIKASAEIVPVRVEIANGTAFIDIDSQYPVIPPGQFHIAEVNYNPAAGAEQWFEVQNDSAGDIDLDGWYLDFGGGNTVTLSAASGTTLLPANGRLVFGQSASSAEGVQVNYAYGTGLVMSTSSGSVGVGISGGIYARASWTSAGTRGVSARFDPSSPQLRLAAGLSALSCAGTGSYGSLGQTGSPGAAHARCMPWSLSSIPGAFQSIAATGRAIWNSTTVGSNDDTTSNIDFTAAGGHTFKMGDKVVGGATSRITVSSNGWVSRTTTSSSTFTNDTAPSTTNINDVFAVFWDDLEGNAAPSGVYWQQFDPDGTAASGDEYTLISWENWKHNNSVASLNFQIRIEEATGSVEYHYGSLTAATPTYANGGTCTVWLESSDSKAALTVGANLDGFLQPNTGYRFTYLP